jgi:hypothetical protein
MNHRTKATMRIIIVALLVGVLSCSKESKMAGAKDLANHQVCAWNDIYAFCLCFYEYPMGVNLESATWVPDRVCGK